MKYLILTYYRKASGQIDEVLTLSNKIKLKDNQTANVILDFRDQKIIRCSINGENGITDWDTVVAYYYNFYPHIIERMFRENGHTMDAVESSPKVSAD